ncbi:MAG: UDP-N-acetylglucosamine 1-carboxyvinyltransferase [Candidatus Niyogibacteria bacterium RIFCSPLOWO2_01_FULL_45_48]|uniref:UDP-N-acetylglucosamine 1-carboxyvinyltransferase n=2 Tax=Candidatus Niyogiibacteriota TaxID=1817912 RepID=A0A1G2EZA1_9BACT|nr:MAG: UDP-N-acetylglucosamine 1-carboxyvinyltransferase [Candidatus Niyogibacteria bacterium RIFCSPLOWO2_01_FULL_45_48]OGZ29369.1 MAG: UDP-N-acetylglucosamine 1-carboxyvinyltransferase [Candidatus Niyogibacteria bacterium RIFCSPHIGHO2_01_FULL_45_28]OGZ30720.1 MAG: UDP-N-acetylglucosamine 1-carboxyvinyltransferase [Candidatus Niyogibacteria bacterium RIFCSPLOWO2_02_FULL_45_13]
MAKFIINGGRLLKGEVAVSGAKNSALKVFAASLLFKNQIQIKNTPLIEDVFRMKELLRAVGARISNSGNKLFNIDPPEEANTDLDKSITQSLRASVVLLGPMLARYGEVSMPHPGGCIIGKRPINFFVDGLKALGAKFSETSGRYFFQAKNLKSAEFAFRTPSVTATETLMMASVLAEGRVILRNCACEPEIESLASFLNESGAKIKGAGTHTIIVEGLGRNGGLKAKSPFTVIPDRIEAGSLLILGALAGKKLLIKNCEPLHLLSLVAHLESAGVKIEKGPDWILVSRPKKISAVDVKTSEYPGFASDLQAPFTVFLTQAEGKSQVFETIFDGRLEYTGELVRMGANITPCDPHRIIVIGPTELAGREVESPDLRAGLAFIMAGLIAKGQTVVHNIYNIDRGYESIETKLSALGADIKRVQ